MVSLEYVFGKPYYVVDMMRREMTISGDIVGEIERFKYLDP